MDYDAILQQMLTTVPRCIANFVATPAERPEPWAGDHIAVWRIACPCGGQYGSFLGYPLSRYNPQYSGIAFVGPLGFECGECRSITELFDTNKHGYHVEVGAPSSKLCGEGPRESLICPDCKGKRFETVASFFYWPASVDLVEDEPEEFEGRAQDLFCEFVAHGRCSDCGNLTRFTDFGKL